MTEIEAGERRKKKEENRREDAPEKRVGKKYESLE